MSGERFGIAILATAVVLAAGCSRAAPPARGPEMVEPGIPISGELLGGARLDRLPAGARLEWEAYIARSARLADADRAAMRAELERLGMERWSPAPQGPPFDAPDDRDAQWWNGAEARRLAGAILSYQTPSGGWSKRIDYSAPRPPGTSYSVSDGWSYIATFDNSATVEEIRFLGSFAAAVDEPAHLDAFRRGVEFVLAAQYPNGCWPQVYPLRGGYHDAATFNDDAMVRVLRLLRDLPRHHGALLTPDLRARAASAFDLGIRCIVDAQVVVDGRRSAWGAQHDPLTLLPVAARAYEPASLSGGESVDVMELLMGIRDPSPEVVAAVHGAADWFRRTAIHGFDYSAREGLVARTGAGPIWARFYEIGTDRPIFSNRDGRILYDWHELEEERRTGYSWFRAEASRALRRYEEWAEQHPR